ncbi:MAG: hypothetical protein D4R73_02730 [Deltaproteobacteria bacterium]|nr:MAG: hypothetical protein D4R73_02730 [Deltaproteobacteria bacterium]
MSFHAEVIFRPIIVCLCGSTRFKEAFTKAQLDETLAGKIVLTIGCNMKADSEIYGHLSSEEFAETKRLLDKLHFSKIKMADEVLILNVGGYIGLSTCDELNYARALGKRVRWLEAPKK